MGNSSKLRIVFLSITMALLTSSCATINSLMDSGDDKSSDVKEVSLDKRLQISIPIPENSMYLTDKTVIFGEGDRFTGVLYLVHDAPAEEIVEFYRVEMRDSGWMELAIVRSNFILMNFDKEDRFATIKVTRKVFNNSLSEVTVGPKTNTIINRSINIENEMDSEPFNVQ